MTEPNEAYAPFDGLSRAGGVRSDGAVGPLIAFFTGTE